MPKKSNKNVKNNAQHYDAVLKTFIVTAIVALPLGYFVGNAVAGDDTDDTSKATMADDSHSHADDMPEQTSHAHDMFVVDAAMAPQITNMMATKDTKSGWNLMIQTENFTFSPQNASGDHVDGEGHAHIYIDGKKITRLYSHNYYLGELSEGEHSIRVTLNTNDHKDYAVNGQVVEATQTVMDMHHADDGDSHDHSD